MLNAYSLQLYDPGMMRRSSTNYHSPQNTHSFCQCTRVHKQRQTRKVSCQCTRVHTDTSTRAFCLLTQIANMCKTAIHALSQIPIFSVKEYAKHAQRCIAYVAQPLYTHVPVLPQNRMHTQREALHTNHEGLRGHRLERVG